MINNDEQIGFKSMTSEEVDAFHKENKSEKEL